MYASGRCKVYEETHIGLKWEMDKSIIITGDFNTPQSVIDRQDRIRIEN